MNRRIKRWVAAVLLGALAFSQASLVLAACAMERGDLARMSSAPVDHDCCDEPAAPQGGDAMPMSATACMNHATSDLQAFNAFPVALTAKAVAAWYFAERPLPPPAAPRGTEPLQAVPPRILLHSFLI